MAKLKNIVRLVRSAILGIAVLVKSRFLKPVQNVMKNIKVIVLYITYIALLFLLIIGIWFIIKDLWRDIQADAVVKFDKFEVSPRMVGEGYSSNNIAEMIVDRMNLLREPAKFRNIRNDDYPRILIKNPIDYEVPYINISLDKIAEYILLAFDQYPYIISGEFIDTKYGVSITVRIEKAKRPFTREFKKFIDANGNIDSLLIDAAYYITNYIDPYSLVGHYYLKFGESDKALSLIKYGLTHDPKSDDAYFYNVWGILLYNEGRDIEESLEKFNKAIDLQPNYAGPYRGAALCYERKKIQQMRWRISKKQ